MDKSLLSSSHAGDAPAGASGRPPPIPRWTSWFSQWNSGWIFCGLLLACFLFRLAYGLSMDFWKDDERQIYLIVLDWFSTHHWPFFGPDVVHTNQQMAGALQALLVGGPLFVLPMPEAPVIFVNILSFIGLLLLGTQLTRLFPELPRALVFLWLMTLPWTLNISTHVYNPSYLLVSSCLFFVAFGELQPDLRCGIMGDKMIFFSLALALAWSFQLHLSWPLLLPFCGVALLQGWRQGRLRGGAVLALVCGLLLPSLALMPTLLHYGWRSPFLPLLANSRVNTANFEAPLTIIARFLSFSTYELPRFLTDRSEDRWTFLRTNWPLIPLALPLLIAGTLQPLLSASAVFRRAVPPAARWLIAGALLEVCLAFCGSSRPPTARNYYILVPVALLAALYGLRVLSSMRLFVPIASLLLATDVAYHGVLAYAHLGVDSLYTRRSVAAAAIEQKAPKIFGERRAVVLPQALR